MASRIASSRVTSLAAPMTTRSTVAGARPTEARRAPPRAGGRARDAAGCGRPPEAGRGRLAGGAEQRVGDRVEGDVAVGVPTSLGATTISMPPAGARCRVRRDGCRGRGRCRAATGASACSTRRRSSGSVDLEVRRLALDRMNGDSPGLQEGGLVREGLGALRREPLHASSSSPRRGTLRGLRGGQPGAIARCRPRARPAPLEGLPDGHDGIAAPCATTAAAIAPTSEGVTRGLAPSWTRTGRSRPSDRGRGASERRRRRTPGGARHPRGRWPPRPAATGPPAPPRPIGRRDDHEALHLGGRRERVDRPGEERTPAHDRVELVDAAHARGRPRGDHHDVDVRAYAGAVPHAGQSRRGWAKIMRPATVWRTRVTPTSTS